jgi:hypothetical protein
MLGSSISKFLKLDNLMSNLTGYLEARMELLKVEIKEDLAKGLARVINYLLLFFVFALAVFFISMAIAIELAKFVGDFWGFGIVALFYLVVGLVLFVSRSALNTKLEQELNKKLNVKK